MRDIEKSANELEQAAMAYGAAAAALKSSIECRMPSSFTSELYNDEKAAIDNLLSVCLDYFNNVFDGGES